MSLTSALTISTGHASLTGVRERNEDFLGMIVPEGAELVNKGIIAAIADGVSGHGGGREAAEYAVRGLLSDYYATPDTWEASLSVDRVTNAINRWVIAQGRSQAEWTGMATTLTALILRGRRYTLAHVGDTRCYLAKRAAGGNGGVLPLLQLTTDHVWDRPGMQHVLTRGIGIDERLHLDFSEGELESGDLFLMLCDGVWESLRDDGLNAMLRVHQEPQALAQALADAALARGSQDNCSALVLRIDSLPDTAESDLTAAGRALPVPPKLKPAQVQDGFTILNVLAESRATLLYTARDEASGQTVVLKTLQPLLAEDADEREAFAREEWMARRVVSRHFAQYIPLEAGRRTALYYAMSWHTGRTWQQMLDAGTHFAIPDTVLHGVQLLKGIGALHRLSVLHRDIKPSNIHIDQGGELRILDLGVATSSAQSQDAAHSPRAGTPSYLAPELFDDAEPSASTDLYSAAVTLYHVLTRHYPYGEVEPFQRPKFGEPEPPIRYRRDLPLWLERVVMKGVARDPKLRFETAEEFVLALERGEAGLLPAPRATPYAARDPASFWRSVALISIITNLLLLYWALVH
jgi:serine/threonine protein phosphatase PrpC